MAVQAAKPARRKTKSKGPSTEVNKSLGKAIRILNAFSEQSPELGVTELAELLQINKSTVYRLLCVMERNGLVEQNPQNDKYRLGLRLVELGNIAVQSRPLQSQARPLLAELARVTRETVHLAIPRDGHVVYLDKIESSNSLISIPSAIGRRLPAYCTGVGKALLAFLPPDEVSQVLERTELKRVTEHTIVSRAELRRHLQQIRVQGYAVDDQEVERGLSCVAAPVWNHEGRVIASISVSGPSNRFQARELQEKIATVREYARRISRSLGYKDVR